ncbi:hypothetical protein V5799_007771 [Amblyomma americanum]|uniref:Uncharacterized protein n=1 Tax=Amblyomma americanum TaxID=6943 RepID=A0AAQ4FF12_AMBAM
MFYNCQEWLDQVQATRLLRCKAKEAASVDPENKDESILASCQETMVMEWASPPQKHSRYYWEFDTKDKQPKRCEDNNGGLP